MGVDWFDYTIAVQCASITGLYSGPELSSLFQFDLDLSVNIDLVIYSKYLCLPLTFTVGVNQWFSPSGL